MAWVRMLWQSDTLGHRCYSGLGTDGLVIGCVQVWMLLWCGFGCSGDRTLSNMDVFLVGVRMLW